MVPLVVDAVAPALVLASGGIADGRGLAAALMLGADGAWVGTRFVATTESAAHDGYKSRWSPPAAPDRPYGPVRAGHPEFNPCGCCATGWWAVAGPGGEIPTDPSRLPVIGTMDLGGERIELRRFSNLVPMRGFTTGDLEEMALLAGQGVGLIDAVEPAATVIEDMTAGSPGRCSPATDDAVAGVPQRRRTPRAMTAAGRARTAGSPRGSSS